MTLGKGLGGGVPIAALVAAEGASCFEYEDQGGTFNGSPLMAAVGCAVVETVRDPRFLDAVVVNGDYLMERLKTLSAELGQDPVHQPAKGRGGRVRLCVSPSTLRGWPVVVGFAGGAMTRVQIVGATGYGGLGMTELLVRHPHLRITSVLAKQDVGKRISDVYPHLQGFCDLPVEDANDDTVGRGAELVVFATPDGVGQSHARRL